MGVGVGASSVAASVISPFVEAITQQPVKKTIEGKEILLFDKALINFGAGLGISIIAGFLASLMVVGVLAWVRSRSASQGKSRRPASK